MIDLRTGDTVLRALAALLLGALTLGACQAARPLPPPPRAQLDVPANDWPEHVALSEHLLTLAALITHAHLTDPAAAAEGVRRYLSALPPDQRDLGQRLAARELALTDPERARFEAHVAPFVAHSHRRLDAALMQLHARAPDAARLTARLLHDWLSF